jgi:hypothetical protein
MAWPPVFDRMTPAERQRRHRAKMKLIKEGKVRPRLPFRPEPAQLSASKLEKLAPGDLARLLIA